MIDDATFRLWIGWMIGAAIITAAILWLEPKAAKAQAAPAIQSITIELKRDRRRFPKFMKFKQRKEQGNAAAAEVQSGRGHGSSHD